MFHGTGYLRVLLGGSLLAVAGACALGTLTVSAAGATTSQGTPTPPALTPATSCGVAGYSLDVDAFPYASYTEAATAQPGAQAEASINSESADPSGHGLPLWGQIVEASGHGALGSAENFPVGSCQQLWKNPDNGTATSVEFMLEQQSSGLLNQEITANGDWTD